MKYLFILFFLVGNLLPTKSQQEFNNWYFGSNLGLSFAGGAPVLLPGGQLNQAEGNATISSANGNLLFYTSGVTIYNAAHNVMTNGNGLMGHASSTQSAIIVKKPLSNSIYYVFTADAETWPNGIRYSEVDMTLSFGLGAVTANKNIPLHTPSSEKLTAVRHCNNRDIWVISHDYNSNTFRTWLVTSTGVNTVPVLCNFGYTPTSVTQQAYGYLKSNSIGSKLAAAYYGVANSVSGNRVEVYDFNNSTGQVTGVTALGNVNGAYGVEFSPNGRYLFASTNTGQLYQWDLCASNIQGSKFLISNFGAFGGALQLGPDSKIYMTRGVNKWISRITNPEVYGFGCGFVDQAISTPTNSNFGLPNFPSYYARPRDDFVYNQTCLSVQFFAPVVNLGICSLSSAISSYLWRFGDGQMSTTANPIHTYSAQGTYSVTLELQYPCYRDTIQIPITVTGSNEAVVTTITQP